MIGEWLVWVFFETGFLVCTIYWGIGIVVTVISFIISLTNFLLGNKRLMDSIWPTSAGLTGIFVLISGWPVLAAGLVKFM